MASTNPRSGPTWLWILAIVVVAALVWWIAAVAGDDAEDYATLEQDVATLREDYLELETEVRTLRDDFDVFREGAAQPGGPEPGDDSGE